SQRCGSSDNSFRVAGDKDDNRPGTLPGVFLGQVPAVFPREIWGRFPGELLRVVPRKGQGKTSSGLREGQAALDAAECQGLTGFVAAPTMRVAGPILMHASPPRPLTDQDG